MKKIRLGVAGLVHDHVWGLLKEFGELEEIEIIAAADRNKPLLQKVKDLFNLSTYEDYEAMFSKEKLDAVLVCTENGRHADVVESASEKGFHVIMEKPMSADFAQAKRIVSASEKHGTKVMVNYPTTWSPAVQLAYRMVKNGDIGRVHHVRFRAAHSGPKEIGCSEYFYSWLYDRELNGAGAFMDYCCYGVNLALWFLGKPKSVVATFGTLARPYLTVDDNAILLMEYGDAFGVAEASWSQVGKYPIHGPILNGLHGTIVVEEDGKMRFVRVREEGNFRNMTEEVIDPPQLPLGLRNGPEYFTRCILDEKPLEPPVDARFNLAVQEVLEAGLISAKEGRRIVLPI
ncbi:MAG: Gfo/Idh/MocA family oxidoreductase [Thermoproteota archaeon]